MKIENLKSSQSTHQYILNTHKKGSQLQHTANTSIPDKKTVQILNPETQQLDVIGEKTAERYAIIKGLLQTDIKQTEIAKLTNYTPEHLSRLKKKLLKIQLVTPTRIKKAIKSAEYFANVENYQDDARIKPSDVLAAGRIFLDRQYPITQVIENAGKIDISIDMSSYRTNTNIIDVKDVTPKSVPSEDKVSSVSLQVSSDDVSV